MRYIGGTYTKPISLPVFGGPGEPRVLTFSLDAEGQAAFCNCSRPVMGGGAEGRRHPVLGMKQDLGCIRYLSPGKAGHIVRLAAR